MHTLATLTVSASSDGETLNARSLKLFASQSMHTLIERTPQWALMLDQGVFETEVTASGRVHTLSETVGLEAVEVLIDRTRRHARLCRSRPEPLGVVPHGP